MGHAVLSPSSASRWLACTPSARLETKFPDTTSDAAREGTVAHALCELLLAEHLEIINPSAAKKERTKIEASEFYGSDMEEHCDNYKTYVLEKLSEAKTRSSDAVIFIESKVNLTDYVPEGFGTRDCAIIADGIMEIIDLKYGKGVSVSAVDNKQMMLYALGSLEEFDFLYAIDTVRMSIFQPRINNYSTFEMSAKDLRAWGDDELKERAKLAFDGEGDFVPGSHCGFCRAKAQCRALADHNLEIAKYDFKEPALLTNDEVGDILQRADALINWANAVTGFAYNEAMAGRTVPGWKLVEGRSIRKIVDEDKAVKLIVGDGWPEDELYNKKLKGIGELEKLVGKTQLPKLLGNVLQKPPGKPTLVVESDKRPALNGLEQAILDFS